ncbi:MAG: hypothetical protein CR991_07070 [Proteobacteria bacterium]|nr:MAG: hypothetical protein CR991_07070 [Pseudomonadota bacterium]
MKTKTILVVGYLSHEQTALQIQTLERFGVNVMVLEPHSSSTPGSFGHFAWDGDKVFLGKTNISPGQISAILLATRIPDTPGKETFMQAPGQRLLWQDWVQHHSVQRHFSEALHSLLLNYEHAGVPMFNPSAQVSMAHHWPYQMRMLQLSGARTPPTLFSNDAIYVKQFINHYGDCTIKPAASASPALSANQLLASGLLQARSFPPAIVQRRIRGDDIRVIMVNGKVIASYMIVRQQHDKGQVQYLETMLPKSVQLQCRRAAALLGLKFNSLVLRRTQEDHYYFIECNPLPQYLETEQRLHLSITNDLCHALLAAD